jgi:hypothetical protein
MVGGGVVDTGVGDQLGQVPGFLDGGRLAAPAGAIES